MKAKLILAVVVCMLVGFIPTAADAKNTIKTDHQSVIDYWTKARLDSSIPKGKASPGGNTGGTWTQGGDVSKTTGKVFFTENGVNYVCSGSAVQSTHENLVLSAGHCVHEGYGGGFVTNWIFYPGWNNGPSSLGAWTATQLYTTPGWATSTDFDDDAGFAVVTGNSGTLEDTVGSGVPSISFDGPSTLDTYSAFGYPASGKYKGQKLIYCEGKVKVAYDGNQTLALPCNMTGGSSGGPWLVNYPSGARVIESLTSYGYASVRNTLFGPIFGVSEQGTYNNARIGNCVSYCTTL